MLKLIIDATDFIVLNRSDLNTSHVKVNLSPIYYWIYCYCNLNTSHVKVNHNFGFLLELLYIYLNTSHVKVNLV